MIKYGNYIDVDTKMTNTHAKNSLVYSLIYKDKLFNLKMGICGFSTRKTTLIAALFVSIFATNNALASPQSPYDQCFVNAAEYHHVNPYILRAIAHVESSYNPHAINRNRNGTYDYGIMQINSSWYPKLRAWGINTATLSDPCSNIFIGAWVLAKSMSTYGNTWRAIAGYNVGTVRATNQTAANRYAMKVWREVQR